MLAHRLNGRSIADVLDLTVRESLAYFADVPGADFGPRLSALAEVGLGYLTLGQPLSTLSGGARQRVKLADRLHRTGELYVLDEPTTGLHMADVAGGHVVFAGTPEDLPAEGASRTAAYLRGDHAPRDRVGGGGDEGEPTGRTVR